jgi:hypothetical protein
MPSDPNTTLRCIDCGAPATRHSSDGVPLCEGDYWHLVEHWRKRWCGEGLDREGRDSTASASSQPAMTFGADRASDP